MTETTLVPIEDVIQERTFEPKPPTNIKVSNPNLLKTVDYRLLKPLQGDLKDLNEKNYNKLKNVLLKRGFTTPFFVWADEVPGKLENGEPTIQVVHYLIDGHQRQRVMLTENMSHNGSYEMPYIEIKAKSRRDAKAQLLEISSQYGTATYEGFDEFTDELENEDFEDINFDALAFVSQDSDNPEGKKVSFTAHPQNAIVIDFTDVNQREACLLEVQEICEKYDSAQIRVKE